MAGVSGTNTCIYLFHDQLEDQVYWQLLNEINIKKTTKHWKVRIPNQNKLDKQSKIQIEDIVINYLPFKEGPALDFEIERILNIKTEPNIVSVSFNIKRNNKSTLFCKISDKRGFEEVPLVYHYGVVLWDKKKMELLWEDTYYYTISDLERYIIERYNSLIINDSPNPISVIIDEIMTGLLLMASKVSQERCLIRKT